ncbi:MULTISPECIES: hypothetical protein [unclassified Leclercia]|uniref:hypothetical protein n=1 Tax=unclassified Leclercia TaxID=2627398 RepID=UPI0020737C8B|nr:MULTISPECIES: hypothetical protein [unclassified Leclercia]MCM5695209.1 hypothetical protein [Leclercia sp. LTM01]MCM5699617.1 hypothetical protein [Leclercia sp. LTM14]
MTNHLAKGYVHPWNFQNRSEGNWHEKKTVTKAQIYRSVASSTAIETGVSVQKIEQQLKQNLAQAKAVGLAR